MLYIHVFNHVCKAHLFVFCKAHCFDIQILVDIDCLDSVCLLDSFSIVLKQKKILSVVEDLYKSREPVPEMKAIYFMSPTAKVTFYKSHGPLFHTST